jgi:hypothetical protein
MKKQDNMIPLKIHDSVVSHTKDVKGDKIPDK